jgi:hypothetical protein
MRAATCFSEIHAIGHFEVTYEQLERYCGGGYVSDEIFGHIKWFNKRPVTNPAGAGCLADVKPNYMNRQ